MGRTHRRGGRREEFYNSERDDFSLGRNLTNAEEKSLDAYDELDSLYLTAIRQFKMGRDREAQKTLKRIVNAKPNYNPRSRGFVLQELPQGVERGIHFEIGRSLVNATRAEVLLKIEKMYFSLNPK